MKDMSEALVIAVSSRALFALEEANEVFESRGIRAYRDYQKERLA
jgi:5'-nucleotidase